MSRNLGRVNWRYTINLKVSYFAGQWGYSDQFIRDLFKNEPGVLSVLRPERSNGRKGGFKREYEPMRIPESVARRVCERLVSKAA